MYLSFEKLRWFFSEKLKAHFLLLMLYVIIWVGGSKCLWSNPFSSFLPQTVCWVHWKTTRKKMVRWKESAQCTCPLSSATPTRMPSMCGTRTTSSSRWLLYMRAQWPALCCLSSPIYPPSFPHTAPVARPAIGPFPRRVMHEAANEDQDNFHVVHLLLTLYPVKPSFTLIYWAS